MKLIIVHYHLRPGGIRRIIELATPHLRRKAAFDSIVLACGEAADREWNETFRRHLLLARTKFVVEACFKYVSEQRLSPKRLRRAVAEAVDQLLTGATAENCVVWAHNLGIARNLALTRELAKACEQRGIPLLAHHHDWWFDNRWLRWAEMRRSGVRNLAATADAVFPATKTIRHLAINRADATVLRHHFGPRASWLPNLTERAKAPAAKRISEARHWLQTRLGERDAPIWILPCRLLRRKNIAEALLLTRWLRPEAWLVTTGGVSSQEERRYGDRLKAAAHRHHWRLHLGVLAEDETGKPSVAELMAVSECVMLTSIQEGFGLPYLEATTAGRPLISRSLPNIAPDLAKFGFRFPQSYEEIYIHPGLFDWPAEQARQAKRFARWKKQLPLALRRLAGSPEVLSQKAQPAAVPFSRLTLDAQLEVLAHPADRSWQLCSSLNPFLNPWQRRTQNKQLAVVRWPQRADRWLSGQSYAESLLSVLRRHPASGPTKRDARRVQAEFFENKLAAANNYPLLWEADV